MKISLMFRTAAVLLIAFISTTMASAQLVPALLNHQGLVTAGGTNFTGTGQFQFALVNGTGGTTYWSNSPVAIALPVNQGLYSVQLGDTNVTNMAALPATVFTNSDVRLRIAFAVSGSPQTLTPDQRIVAVGYALMAQTVADGAITSSKLASSITNVTVVAGAGLSGGGVTSLGGTTTLALDLTRTNFWAAPQTINGSLTVTGNVLTAGSLIATGDVLAARLNIGSGNTVSGAWATVAGGSTNTASGNFSIIGGGFTNLALASFATVGGGSNNTAGDIGATVAGGIGNTASNQSATVSGGYRNSAVGVGAFVGGGGTDGIQSGGNLAGGAAAVIGGGVFNSATNSYATISGGLGNTISGPYATIGGGSNNMANGVGALIGGGFGNVANSTNTTIGGGWNNTASGSYASVGGGYSNVASGVGSFAAGSHAHATNNGAFVWGDNSGVPIGSTGSNSVTFQCNGGVTFTSGTVVGLSTQTVAWVPGNLGWTYTSDKYSKQGFTPVDARSVLEKVGRLPITEWNYIGYSQRHIGPMAQDWHALFPLNPSDVTINSADMTGVSLVAIQGLYQELQEAKSQNAALEKRLAELEKLIGQLARPEGK